MHTTNRRTELVFILFFMSGMAGLIYESVWTHYVKLFLGHAAYAQTLVLVVFIGGLALGSWLCARAAERIRNPLRAYAWIEGAIGLLALVFHGVFVRAVDWAYGSLLPSTCDPSSTLCVSQWLISALLLAPQSILLGATFPLVSSAVLRLSSEHPGHHIASLYFLNSLGAVLGVMASAFVLIPLVGLPGTLHTAGIANVLIGIAAYGLSREAPPALAVEAARPAQAGEITDSALVRVLLATALLTGLSSFIYEIAWIRMLSLVLGASTHSFEIMLASFILGIALGGLWIRGRVDAAADTVRFLAYVQLAMGALAVATLPLYNASFDLMAWLLMALSTNDAGFVLFNMASTAISLLIMLPATFCAGMTLPLITYRLLRSPAGERSLGATYAINTLGSIVGVIVAVHLLMPNIGMIGALIVGGAIDVALGIWLLATRSRTGATWRLPAPALAVVVAFVAIALFARVDPAHVASGVFRTGSARVATPVLFHADGKTATVHVVGDEKRKAIRTNGKTDAAITMNGETPTSDEQTMAMLGFLPLGFNPQARTAAVIGFGSGYSTSVLLSSDRLERVDTIEIEPAMLEGAKHFRPIVNAAFDDPRSHIVIDDAKSYFARGRAKYDIIVSEPSNPWVSGVASLFTEEFYRRLSVYMNDGGVLAQWLHLYEMDSATFASIVEALRRTFPNFVVYRSAPGDIVVIARKNGMPGKFDDRILEWPRLKPTLQQLRIDAQGVRERAVGSSATLVPYFASYASPPNSDFFPVVDRGASKARFTHVHVFDFEKLHDSGVPLLEMLDGTFTPRTAVSREERDAIVRTLFSNSLRRAGNDSDPVGRLAQLWSSNCGSDWTFPEVLPTLVGVAAAVTPQFQSELATAPWRMVAESRCGRALSGEEHRWLELFAAVAARDADRMATLGEALVRMTKVPDAASEYAFLAATTGLICKGEATQAREFMDAAIGRAMRRGSQEVQIRYLHAIVMDPKAAAAAARCR